MFIRTTSWESLGEGLQEVVKFVKPIKGKLPRWISKWLTPTYELVTFLIFGGLN